MGAECDSQMLSELISVLNESIVRRKIRLEKVLWSQSVVMGKLSQFNCSSLFQLCRHTFGWGGLLFEIERLQVCFSGNAKVSVV